MSREYSLEIEGPSATCGHCRFTSALAGTFSVEDGLLVWRGAPDVQPTARTWPVVLLRVQPGCRVRVHHGR